MSSDHTAYMPFSQRTGLAPIPPQLKLGEVSDELRRLIDYYVQLEIDRETQRTTISEPPLKAGWMRVSADLHVLFFGFPINSFDYRAEFAIQRFRSAIARTNFFRLFDLVEFLVRHPNCSDELKSDLSQAFVRARRISHLRQRLHCCDRI